MPIIELMNPISPQIEVCMLVEFVVWANARGSEAAEKQIPISNMYSGTRISCEVLALCINIPNLI